MGKVISDIPRTKDLAEDVGKFLGNPSSRA